MGTIYWAVYPSAQGDPTDTAIITETVANGIFGSDIAPTVTTDPFVGTPITGLLPGVSYKLASVWDDTTATSTVVVSAAFTTLTALTLTSINPTSGPSTGGTTVTMTGTGFEVGTIPRFNGVEATDVVIVSSTELTCVTPPFYSITGPGQFLSPTGSDFFITSEGKAFVVGISFSPLGSDLLITSDGDMFIV